MWGGRHWTKKGLRPLLRTDEDRQQFVQQFRMRHGPVPETLANDGLPCSRCTGVSGGGGQRNEMSGVSVDKSIDWVMER
jgi:hypothetical protein